MQILTHPFEPFFDENSKVLVLGSFPSIKSREENFYYQHSKIVFGVFLKYYLSVS